MIAAVGAHFTNNPTVKVVAASFANATSEDWNVPHKSVDVQNWFAAGYTTEKLLDAGKQIIDTTMTAFPNQYVTLAIGGNGHVGGGPTENLDPSTTYVADNSIATARASWPGRLVVQINSVSNSNPDAPGPDDSRWNTLWNSRPDVAGQMVYWCYDEPTYRVNGGVPGDPADILTNCINRAASYGLNYLEVYQKDVLSLPDVISYGDQILRPTGPAALLNVSTRLEVGPDDRAAITGFILDGTRSKTVMLRAIGPSLAKAGIADPLLDPVLELHDSSGKIIATNDNWQTTQLGTLITSDQVAAIESSTIPPSDPSESAIIATLTPASYTAVIHGKNNVTGIVLAEVYDLSQPVSTTVANLSTRGWVGVAPNVLIGGFIVGVGGISNVIVRALGPSLPSSKVNNPLADPLLDLRNANGTLVASNDDWADTQASDLMAADLAPVDSHESALEASLLPGSYTAIVTGKNRGVGVGLVELYRLP